MNCPSRTDDTLLHCDWNQNPPFLAPDLTTRQDLNGITNARVLKDARVMSLSRHSLDDADSPMTRKLESDQSRHMPLRASLTQSGKFENMPIGRSYALTPDRTPERSR